jgi:eukaryotic-like serine/threonine-protein kinase
VDGGAIRDLAPAPDGRGGSWSGDGIILYAPDVYGAVYRIPAEGGTPEPATKVAQPTGSSVTHRLPHFLPDGKHFLFSKGVRNNTDGRLMAGTLGTLENRQVLDRASNVTYADGFLFYLLDGVLLAQRFDPDEFRFNGKAAAVASGLEGWPFRFLGNYSYSAGRLVYREAVLPEARIEWFDPGSGARSTGLEPGAYSAMRLSPDGRQLLVARPEGQGSREHVWLYELGEGSWSRLTRRPEVQYKLAWMPDARHAVLQPDNGDSAQFVSLDGAIETVAKGANDTPIMDWVAGGEIVIGQRQVQETGFDLVRWSGVRDGMPIEVLSATPADERGPRISPDGRYVAYFSNQSGREEVYLARLPGVTGERQASLDGALFSDRGGLAWSRTRPVLYFLGPGGTLQGVPVTTSPELRLGKPSAVAGAPANITAIDAAPDGRLLLLYTDRSMGAPLTLVDNLMTRLQAQ